MTRPEWFPGNLAQYSTLARLADDGYTTIAPMLSPQRPTRAQLEAAVDSISDVLIESGFDGPDSISEKGLMLEDLIDRLQDVIEAITECD